MQWIKIYYASNEIDAASVKGFLESHDIKVKVVPKSSASTLKSPLFYTNATIPYEIFVPEENKNQAEKLLRESK